MKTLTNLFVKALAATAVATLIITFSCKKKSDSTPTPATTSSFTQTNLVADTAGFNATRIDPGLQDAWGLVVNPAAGLIWVTSNGPGTSVVYDSLGNQKLAPVAIPAGVASGGTAALGTPSGVIYNTTTGFALNGSPAKFIFVTEDGTVSAWNNTANTSATLVVDSSANGAVYKGVTIARSGSSDYLYVANFEQRRVDVYDTTFKYTTGFSFNDPTIPSDYAPFNINYIGGQLYVVYAMLKAGSNDDQAGPGNGYISVFNTNGSFVKRLVSNGNLNSPWAIVQAPSTFGQFANDLLVSNFGDGTISAYDLNGNFKGQLEDNTGKVIAIEGIWGLMFPTNGQPAVNPNRLYFTAGPDDENHGLFGYLTITTK